MKMGARYRNLPIRQKLRLIIMATVATALILACAAFLVYDQIALRNSLLANTAVTAEMIGSNSTGALSFGDQKAANELLRTLRAQRSMVAAALYSASGQLFAVYLRDGAQQQTPFPRLRADGSWFEDDRLKLFRRVVLAQQTIGAVYLESDLAEIHARLKTFLGTTMIVLLATSLLAFALSSWLQGSISEPIADLARAGMRRKGLAADEDEGLVAGFSRVGVEVVEVDLVALGVTEVHDRVGSGGRAVRQALEDETVVARAAVERIPAETADENVGAAQPLQYVIAAETKDDVAAAGGVREAILDEHRAARDDQGPRPGPVRRGQHALQPRRRQCADHATNPVLRDARVAGHMA
jgi:hypothetical protein